MHAHVGAELVQMVSDGLAYSGSSSVPALRMISSGRRSDALVTGVPHFSQNLRCMWLPLSAILEKSRSGPVMVTALARNMRFTVALPAAKYWQSRHQHTLVETASALAA
jgi:hypothetical protein